MSRVIVTAATISLLVGCASYDERQVVKTLPAPAVQSAKHPVVDGVEGVSSSPVRVLKRKIAIARFTNETRYGSGRFLSDLFVDESTDRIGKQASDMLAADLTKSGKFIVLERTDLNKLQAESELMGMSAEDFKKNLVGVDALILGAVVEFGRKNTGEVKMFTRSRKQVAHAKVNIRLVDPRSGHVFFSEDGGGEASLESSTVLGLGDQAAFDATLNDKAMSAAIANVLDKVLNKLADKPWTSGILDVDRETIVIAGGERQGLRIGDRLKVMLPGKVIKSPQTGFNVQLPHTQVGELEVVQFFGDDETNEGSICRVVDGITPTTDHILQF